MLFLGEKFKSQCTVHRFFSAMGRQRFRQRPPQQLVSESGLQKRSELTHRGPVAQVSVNLCDISTVCLNSTSQLIVTDAP